MKSDTLSSKSRSSSVESEPGCAVTLLEVVGVVEVLEVADCGDLTDAPVFDRVGPPDVKDEDGPGPAPLGRPLDVFATPRPAAPCPEEPDVGALLLDSAEPDVLDAVLGAPLVVFGSVAC